MATPEQSSPETITVTIDGEERTLPKKPGQTIIQVCDDLGIEIPRFCYHKHLTIPANCRMCLVEVEKAPKLMPSCHTHVADGMVINTRNERVKQSQEAVLEFLLVNHPVDCPICDQAGECPLQDQYFKYDRQPSRVGPPERKVKKGKGVRVGPRVTLDQERCVLCTRCTRFMDEVAREPQLGMFWRNDHAYISTFPGQPLSSNYSLNTVAICPVGALTSTDFRFQKRVWELKTTPSICDGCSRGCNAWLDRDGTRVYRLRARDNDAVNRSWMCDTGLLSYGFMNENRVLSPRLGRKAAPTPGASVTAAEQIAARMNSLVGKTESLGVLVSARVSVEDALMAAWFVKEVLKGDRIFLGGREEGEKDAILLRDDRNPNRLGVDLAAKAFGLNLRPFDDLLQAVDDGAVTVVYAIGGDVPTAPSLAVEVFSALEYLAVQASNHDELTRTADAVLPAATYAEYDGTFVNFMGRLQRFWQSLEPRGEAAAHWDWLAEIARNMGHSVDYHDSDDVFAELAPRSEALSGVGFEAIGQDGILLPGIGAQEDQTGAKGLAEEKGVSRWPR
jgi:NADH-quinone oxidoreductase subunit G